MRIHPPEWWPWAAIAVAWAATVLGLCVASTFLIPPIDSWSRDSQLYLFQAAVGFAGFGAGTITLVFAAAQVRQRFGRPEIDALFDPDHLDWVDLLAATDSRTLFAIELLNASRIVATAWQAEITIEGPGRITPRIVDAVQRPDARSAVLNSPAPLFFGSKYPIGHVQLELNRDDLTRFGPPAREAVYGHAMVGEWECAIAVLISTEFGTRRSALRFRIRGPRPG